MMPKPVVWIVATSVLVLGACEEKPKGACGEKGTKVEISGNHAHQLELPAEGLASDGAKTYALKGGSHEHAVGLKAEHAKQLASGDVAKTRSSSVNAHVHELEIRCNP